MAASSGSWASIETLHLRGGVDLPSIISELDIEVAVRAQRVTVIPETLLLVWGRKRSDVK